MIMTTQATPAISDETVQAVYSDKAVLKGLSHFRNGNWSEDTLIRTILEASRLRASTPTALDRLRLVDGLEELRKLSEKAEDGDLAFVKSANNDQIVGTGMVIITENVACRRDGEFLVACWNFVRNLLSTAPQASAMAQEPERRASEDKGGEAVASNCRCDQGPHVEAARVCPECAEVYATETFAIPRSSDEAQEAAKVRALEWKESDPAFAGDTSATAATMIGKYYVFSFDCHGVKVHGWQRHDTGDQHTASYAEAKAAAQADYERRILSALTTPLVDPAGPMAEHIDTDHLLFCLAEECDEVGQRIMKALRFGLDEVQPGQSLNNAERIVAELHDLISVALMLERRQVLRDIYPTGRIIEEKRARIAKYTAISKTHSSSEPRT